jgi:hypothetical protein
MLLLNNADVNARSNHRYEDYRPCAPIMALLISFCCIVFLKVAHDFLLLQPTHPPNHRCLKWTRRRVQVADFSKSRLSHLAARCKCDATPLSGLLRTLVMLFDTHSMSSPCSGGLYGPMTALREAIQHMREEEKNVKEGHCMNRRSDSRVKEFSDVVACLRGAGATE